MLLGHHAQHRPHGKHKQDSRNSLIKSERKLREKPREKFSRNQFPIQPRCAHVLRIASDLKSPKTRAPTRTPCGETGSEGSWLRVARGPTSSCQPNLLY